MIFYLGLFDRFVYYNFFGHANQSFKKNWQNKYIKKNIQIELSGCWQTFSLCLSDCYFSAAAVVAAKANDFVQNDREFCVCICFDSDKGLYFLGKLLIVIINFISMTSS